MAFRIRDNDHGYKELVKRVFAFGAPKITVGVHAKEGAEAHEGGPAGVTLADVATWNEFGAGTTPERSFIRAWFDENQPRIKEAIRRLLTQVIEGKISEDIALERLGLWMQGEIQKKIAAGIPPPNAARTIEKKGSDKPLVNTGQLRAGITFEVEGPAGKRSADVSVTDVSGKQWDVKQRKSGSLGYKQKP